MASMASSSRPRAARSALISGAPVAWSTGGDVSGPWTSQPAGSPCSRRATSFHRLAIVVVQLALAKQPEVGSRPFEVIG